MSDYAFEGPKWPTSTVTWSFAAANYLSDFRSRFSDQIGTAYQATIISAVHRWAAVSGLDLIEVPDASNVDVRIGWGRFAGSTIGETSFSSVNGALSPDVIVRLEDPLFHPLAQTASGAWVYSGTESTLYQVALHEIGHSLGLAHSTDQNAIMFPVATAANTQLDTSDITGIQALYGLAAADSQTTADSGPGRVIPITTDTIEVYRFFDTNYGTHFLTADPTEAAEVAKTRPDLKFEGFAMSAAPANGSDPNAAPVYRFFDTTRGTHFFTASASERDSVVATRPDLTFEGTGFYEHTTQQPGDAPVERFFDTRYGTHFYTADSGERASIVATRPDLKDEGIGFYAPSR